MNNLEIIKTLIKDELDYIYCHNCANINGDSCCDCHRKYMMWEISDECLNNLSINILNNINGISNI